MRQNKSQTLSTAGWSTNHVLYEAQDLVIRLVQMDAFVLLIFTLFEIRPCPPNPELKNEPFESLRDWIAWGGKLVRKPVSEMGIGLKSPNFQARTLTIRPSFLSDGYGKCHNHKRLTDSLSSCPCLNWPFGFHC